MRDVQALAEEIVAREGGFVNDPNDPGGATNFGVTIHTMRRLGLDLTGDGQVSEADVRALTRVRCGGDLCRALLPPAAASAELPRSSVQPSVFDMYVNAGANAVHILQRLLIDMGYDIDADGVLGPRNILACRRGRMRRRARPFGDAYGIARRNYYYMRWPIAARPAANYARSATVARAAGSPAPRSSSRPAIT